LTDRAALTAELIEGFAGAYLSPMYDNPAPVPDFHREAWAVYCAPDELAAIAAPRSHAKSSALTHAYVLATVLFRVQDYVVIVSATEELSIGHLGDIAKELRDNDDLIADFGIGGFETDAKTDIVVAFKDGHRCRIIARGSGQKMRGLKWHGKRPGLVVCDDLEEDAQVENLDMRRRFRRWFYRALLPVRRKGGVVRVHGTILHEDSLLARLMKAKTWTTRLYRAHAGFDDFSGILWPEQFDEERLRAIRQQFIDDGDAAGYSQEYLNAPMDSSDAYLRKDDFLPMDEDDHYKDKIIAIGCDFAVSKAASADRTSFTVGGKDVDNLTHIIDQHAGRWSTVEWIDLMFTLQRRYNPVAFFVEGGVIWRSISPMLYKEMQQRDTWLSLAVINPTKDKATRGRAFQKRMQAGGMRFDTEASWFPTYQEELLRFTGRSEALHDDQFDSTALLMQGFETMADAQADDFMSDDEIEFEKADPRRTVGRSRITGY
jgi:predicted phage terminase large subunit-like protein